MKRSQAHFMLLVALAMGCEAATTPTASERSTGETPQATNESPSELAAKEALQSTDAVGGSSDIAVGSSTETYPEKPDVLRLMHTANTQFQSGQFQAAQTIVDQVLQLDPSSPAALNLKKKIDDILVRS